jgi:undecaprenyl-diphosphatase
MPEILKIILLGIIEGFTEFLPISSTGHLILATALLEPAMSPNAVDTFNIFIQFGAVVAVVAYFWRDISGMIRRLPNDRPTQRFALSMAIAFMPAAVLGVIFRSVIKESLFNPTVVAVSLLVGGIVLIVIERIPAIRDRAAGAVDLSAVTLPRALLIGVAQSAALIPGVSRSAASIVGGMGSGLNRQTATAFSFYLAIPTLGLATIADLLLSLDELQPSDLPYFALGALVAGITAWFSIRWLLRYVASHTFVPFGIYRIALGILVLIWSLSLAASQR